MQTAGSVLSMVQETLRSPSVKKEHGDTVPVALYSRIMSHSVISSLLWR